MDSALAIDEFAAEALLDLPDLPEQFWSFPPSGLSEPPLAINKWGDVVFIRVPKTSQSKRFLIFPLTADGFFDGVDKGIRPTVLNRCLRAGLARLHPGTYLPPSWGPYSLGHYQLFYAATIAQGRKGSRSRVILEYNSALSPHVLFTEYFPEGEPIDLRAYQTPVSSKNAVLRVEHSALNLPLPIRFEVDSNSITLTLAEQVLTHGLTYSEWTKQLTTPQSIFVNAPLAGITKLRGVAGTGKTLSLMLKAVHDAYEADGDWRGVYITHNWSAAQVVRDTLPTLDADKLLARPGVALQALTLQALAGELLQLQTADVVPLSEDGYEGKVLQLETIERLVDDFSRRDWALYQSRCTPKFRARLTAGKGTVEARRFAWDLMNEFACVLSAERGMVLERYLRQKRHKWMVDLQNDAEREVAYLIHERFRRFLHDDLKVLATYDVVNDLLRYLDSNTWDVRRRQIGYDELFVDEFHLFNKQEQLVFQYLTRNPSQHPKGAVALDPRQSPSESFIGVLAESEEASARSQLLSGARVVLLDYAFRYTNEISKFISSLEQFWFGFGLGEDFLGTVREARGNGSAPDLVELPSLRDSVGVALKFADATARRQESAGRTVAVLCLGMDTMKRIQAITSGVEMEKRIRIISSREDAISAGRPSDRRFVVSQPEYVAGLQFDTVVIVDANDTLVPRGMDTPLEMRRILSAVYLGASRAKSRLRFYSATDQGGPLRFLKPALESGSLVAGSSA